MTTLVNAVGRDLTPAERRALVHMNGANDFASGAALADRAGNTADARDMRRVARHARSLAVGILRSAVTA